MISAVLAGGYGLTAQEMPDVSGSGGEGAAQSKEAIQEKVKTLESKFVEVVEKIQAVEDKALQDEEVASAKDTFEETLAEQILKEKPELEEALKKRDKYQEYLEGARNGKSLPEDVDMDEVYSEYNDIQRKVMPVEREIMAEDEMKSLHQEYQEKLVAKMKEIEPEIMDLVNQQNELREKYQQLMQKMRGMDS